MPSGPKSSRAFREMRPSSFLLVSNVAKLVVHFNAPGNPGGRHFLMWPKHVCAAEQGVVFRVLSHEQGIKSHYLTS